MWRPNRNFCCLLTFVRHQEWTVATTSGKFECVAAALTRASFQLFKGPRVNVINITQQGTQPLPLRYDIHSTADAKLAPRLIKQRERVLQYSPTP